MATALVDCSNSSVYPIGEFPFTIGRHPSSRLSLNDPCVSRLHCAIWDIHGQHFLIDLSSKNGTYRNRQVVVRTPLKNGDRITIGGTEFLYRRDRTTRMLESSSVPAPAAKPEFRKPVFAKPKQPAVNARRSPGLRRAEYAVLAACAGLAIVALLSPIGSLRGTWTVPREDRAGLVGAGSNPTSAERAMEKQDVPAAVASTKPQAREEEAGPPSVSDTASRVPADPHRANLERFLQGGRPEDPIVIPPAPPSPMATGAEPVRFPGSMPSRPVRSIEDEMQRFSALSARAEVMALSGQHAKVQEILARMRDDFPSSFQPRIVALEAHLRQLASQR